MSSAQTSKMPRTGFPTGSKILRKQEKERAYKLHVDKMHGIRHGVDNSPPEKYSHLVVRLKRVQKEEEKQAAVDYENQLLMRKMKRIMTRRGRLDNWNDYQRKSLNVNHRERQQEQIAIENVGIAKRLERVGPVYDVNLWEEDYKRHEEILERRADETKDYDDNLTPRKQTRGSKTRQQQKEKKKDKDDEDKYEDDFESDDDGKNKTEDGGDKDQDEKTSQKSTESEKGKSDKGTETERRDSKLPQIESKKKNRDKEAGKEKPQSKSKQSQVSKLPAVNSSSKKYEDRANNKKGRGKKNVSSKSQSSAARNSVKKDEESRESEVDNHDNKNQVESETDRHDNANQDQNVTDHHDNTNQDETEADRHGNASKDEGSRRSSGQSRSAKSTARKDAETGETGQINPRGSGEKNGSGTDETVNHNNVNEESSSETKTEKAEVLSSSTNDDKASKSDSLADQSESNSNTNDKGTHSDDNHSTTSATGKIDENVHQQQSAEKASKETGHSAGERRDAASAQPSSRNSNRSEIENEGGTTLAESDAKQLFRVCKQMDKPDETLIKTLVRRSYQQRMQAKSKFRDMYDLDLVPELKEGLGSPWHSLINALLTEKETSDASAIHSALWTIDIPSIVEILCTRNTSALNSLKEAYRKEYAISLESEFTEKTEAPVQLLLLTLLKGKSSESTDVNESEAEKDARELHESGEGRFTSESGKFIRLLEQKSSAQFRAILNMYKQISGGKDVMAVISHECSDQEDYVNALSTLVNCTKGAQLYFAEKLHKCKDLEDSTFVATLVSRAEVDMPTTRKVYMKKYSKELADSISAKGPHETMKVLLEFVNKPAPSQNKSKSGQPGAKKNTGGGAGGGAPPKRQPPKRQEKKDGAANLKNNPLDRSGKRAMAVENKQKRDAETKGKAKQASDKREKTKSNMEGKEKAGSDDNSNSSTVKGSKDFNAEKDADRLYKAMDGLGTNEMEIIEILPERSNAQRQDIKKAYSKKYNRDLVEDLKSELRGDFEELILALMMRPPEYDAYCLNDAVKGLGTDEAALVGILCTRSNKDMAEIKEEYKNAYKANLEEDVSEDTSNAFKEMLLELVKAGRDSGSTVDENLVDEDVKKLYNDSNTPLSVKDGTLKTIVTQRNRAQVKATFDKYKEVAGQDIYEGIKLAMIGDDQEGYIGLAKALDDTVDFYAERLNQSMTQSVGTDDKMLVRILVSRSEIDLATIKTRFQELYKKSLRDSVESECSGDYKTALIAVLGDNQVIHCTSSQTTDTRDEKSKSLNHRKSNEIVQVGVRANGDGRRESSETSAGSRTELNTIEEEGGSGTKVTDPTGAKEALQSNGAAEVINSTHSDNDVTADVIKSSQSDIAADVIKSDIPADNIKTNQSDISADVIKSSRNNISDDVIKSSDDIPVDVVKSSQNNIDVDTVKSSRNDIAVDIVKSSQSDIAADAVKSSQNDIPSDVIKSDIPVDDTQTDQSENHDGVIRSSNNDVPTDVIKPAISANVINSGQSAVHDDAIELAPSDIASDAMEANLSDSGTDPVEPQQFEPGRDCESLFSLLNDKDTDDTTLFDILTKRNHKQRLQLRQKYQLLYRQDLVREMRNKLSPTLEIVLGALMLDPVEYDALCIHQAVAGIAVDDRTLVNILISGKPVHLKAVKIKFWQVYGKDLIDYLRKITNAELGELLLCLSCVTEDKGPYKNEQEQITEEANKLAKKLPTGQKSYLDVFHKKSSQHLQKVFTKYAEITGKDISDSFMKYKTGEVQRALTAFASWLQDPIQFYSSQLKTAMSDPGVDGIILIHIITSRAEIDLKQITSAYRESYGVSLKDDLQSKCRGDYKKVLIPLVEGI